MSYKDRYFSQSMRIQARANDRRYNCALDIFVDYDEDGVGGETELLEARRLLNEILYGVDGTKDAPTYGADRRNPDAIALLREVNTTIRNDFPAAQPDPNC